MTNGTSLYGIAVMDIYFLLERIEGKQHKVASPGMCC